jgi:D-serine deaminase-like pyridoxal phosphate-dependent protein
MRNYRHQNCEGMMPYSSEMANNKVKVADLNSRTMNPFYKGMPLQGYGQTIKDFLLTKPNLFTSGFQFPVAVLRESALENNLQRMAEYCKEVGASLAPHVKTTMAPQIAQRQIDHGAWALTLANYSQAQVFLDFGFSRIIIANEIVDLNAIRAIAVRNLELDTEIFFYLDSVAGFEIIQNALKGLKEARLHLFVEIGATGGRGGIRDIHEVQALAEKVKGDPRLTLRGVAGFEGIVPGADRSVEGIVVLRKFCQKIVAAAKILGPYVTNEEIIITAGGSAYFDVVIEEFAKYGANAHIVLRSGGYVSHDHGSYERTYPFAHEAIGKRFFPAIELWAQVLTSPEPKLAILNLGKRDVGNDIENPFPIKRYRDQVEPLIGEIEHLNDQHGYLKFENDQEILVGDVIGMGISHPCTTFDKWRLMPVVNDDYDVVDLIHTFF